MTSPLRLTVHRTDGSVGPAARVRVRLEVPSDLSCIEEAVELLALHCFAGRSPSRRTAFRLRVALAEALANAVQAALRTEHPQRVRITADLDAEQVRVAVADPGAGFNPADLPDPTLPDTVERERGRGLFLIHQLADHVEFNDQGNIIWMTLPRC
jgi:serine/threonine-protein kinase RsbW